jgi:hypothetical protein
MQYAIGHLVEAGDDEAAEKLADWLDNMRENMVPIAKITDILDLLDEWVDAMPCTDTDVVAKIYLKTKIKLNDLRGR